MKKNFDVDNLVITLTFDEFDEFASVMKSLRGFTEASPVKQSESKTIDSGAGTSIPEDKIRRMLSRIQGQRSSPFLWVLANSPSFTATDAQLRDAIPEATTLAPFASHIAKACKMEGFEIGDVVLKKSRRGTGGKIDYRYKLDETCAKIILQSSRFVEERPELPPDMAWE